MKCITSLFFLLCFYCSKSQSVLSVEKIMRDPKWIGTSPSNLNWSPDGRMLFFNWNPEMAPADSLYYISVSDKNPRKAATTLQQSMPSSSNITWNNNQTTYTYSRWGDLFYVDQRNGNTTRITQTVEAESNPVFVENDTKIAFARSQNLFTYDLKNGSILQLTNLQRGTAVQAATLDAQQAWLEKDQLLTSAILRERKTKREAAEVARKNAEPQALKIIYTGDRNVSGLTISPNARFATYRLVRNPAGARSTYVPDYMAESGFTTNLTARAKVGAPESTSTFYIYDRERDTAIAVNTSNLPGIKDDPDYLKDYAADSARKKNQVRQVTIYGPFWSPGGRTAIVDVRSADNKDRWIMQLDPLSGNLKHLYRQRDEAWVGGPGVNSMFVSSPWIDENRFWFQSEETGYAHLYVFNISSGSKTTLTEGKFEVQSVRLSKDNKTFYIGTNEVHPGEQHFYRLPVAGGRREKITSMTGAHQVTVSPDEKNLAILYSYSNKPWELYLQENKPGGKIQQITFKAQSQEFAAYPWRDPQIITFRAKDGADVYARLYKPENPHPTKPAVIFVHGAGYLQNVHKWWSSYFREYMFHNLLTDLGYTVLDIDFRASSGYGRDWRTGIYRYMGGKDLSDQVDGAKYLSSVHGVDPGRIGIYGGSYGGFITLMALFTEPDVFAAGAALRSVTDWAHYNDSYTSNILNEPYNDSLAYRKSSPIYYAEGLKKPLLMCHGMVDVNVHFQDIVRLTQRLIELKKENWELAVYPVEDHAFTEPSSWMDEYKRILKLFETHLKK